MTGRVVVIGVVVILLAGAIWTLSMRKPKSVASTFKDWYPDK